MRLLMMVFVCVLMLGANGAGGNFSLVQSAQAGGASASGGAGHFEYVELDPLILPIVNKTGVSQVVSMVISLEVANASSGDKVRRMSPKLTDAYIQDLYGMLNEHAALKGGVIQIGYIKKRLNKISKQVMGDDHIHDVLLQVVQQRPV